MITITAVVLHMSCVFQAPIEQVQARTDSLVADVRQMKEAIQDLVKTNTVMAEMIRNLAARKASPPPAAETSEDAVVSNI